MPGYSLKQLKRSILLIEIRHISLKILWAVSETFSTHLLTNMKIIKEIYTCLRISKQAMARTHVYFVPVLLRRLYSGQINKITTLWLDFKYGCDIIFFFYSDFVTREG